MVVPVSVAVKVGTVAETGFPYASFRVIVTVEVATPSAVLAVPVMVEVVVEAAPPVKTTVPPVAVTGEEMESVLVSAWVDLSVQVEEPVALVAEQAP